MDEPTPTQPVPVTRVLIVDDDPMMQQVLRRAMSADGREVEVVSTGREAIERVREGNVQLLILDLGLPDMSGMKVLDDVRENSPETDVVVVTANHAVPVVVDALRRGAADFLVKPVSVDELQPVVARILSDRQLRLESDVAVILGRLVSVQDVNDLIPEVCDAARDAALADHVTLFLWDGQALEAVGSDPAKGHVAMARAVMEDGLPKRVPGNALQRSQLAWPLIAHNAAIGVLVVSRDRGEPPFSYEAERKLSIVATGSAVEIDRARLIQHLQHQVDELVRTRMQLSTAEQSEGIAALATGYAHELQGPLQVVQSQVRGALSSMDDPEEAAQHLRYALESIARIQGAVGDLSLLGRNRDDTEVDAARLVGLAERMADLRGIPVAIEIMDATVRGNVGLYTQALSQLLRNAARACRDVDDAAISVGFATGEGTVAIAIRDNGHGIPKAIREQVFEPFFSTWEGHSGLGLGMVASAVDSVGGSIALEPGAEGGTVATVTLPAGEAVHDLFAFGDGTTLADTEHDTFTDEV